MKTCVVRRRFWTSEVANTATLDVDLEPNFGTAKGIIIFYVENSATTDAFQSTLTSTTCGIAFAQASLSSGTGATLTTVMSSGVDDNVSTTNIHTYHTTVRLLSAFDAATRGITYWRGNTVTFLPDKLRFAFSASTPQTNGHLDTLIWAITGDDVSVAVGTSSFNSGGTGSVRLLSGLGWQPDVVFLATQNSIKDQNVNNINGNVSFGAATRDPNQQGGFGWNYQDGTATNTISVRSDSQKIIATGGSIGSSITINSDGWSMYSQGTFAANVIYQYFAIKGLSASDFAFINFSTPTSTGVDFSGLGSSGFVPETIIGATTYCDTQNTFNSTSATGADGFGLFAGMASTHSKLYTGNGTITYSTASSTVTGSGTTFFKFAPGFRLYTPEGLSIGTVSSVASTTSLTLSATALLNGTAVNYTYAPHSQGTILFGDDDNTTPTTVVSRCSSGFSVYQQVTSGTPIAAINGYLSTPDTRPGIEFNFPTVDASVRYGFLVAFKNQTASRRRGRLA